MNNVDIERINGILNFYSDSQDFLEQYERMGSSYIYNIDGIEEKRKFGLVITTANKKKCIPVLLNQRSFLNLKLYLDQHTKQIPSCAGLFNILSNIYDINLICAFVREVHNDMFYTFLVTEKNGQFFCINTFLSDAVCFTRTMDFPLYMNKKIVEDKGILPSEINDFIVS